MWKNRGADTGIASCSVVEKLTAIETWRSFYHLVRQVIHKFTGEDCRGLNPWTSRGLLALTQLIVNKHSGAINNALKDNCYLSTREKDHQRPETCDNNGRLARCEQSRYS
jgi:hypothetical protein